MKRKIKRCALTLLTMVPVASVAFAAKSALQVSQIGGRRASDRQLARSSADSQH